MRRMNDFQKEMFIAIVKECVATTISCLLLILLTFLMFKIMLG